MTTELMILPEFKFETFAPAVIEFNYRELADALDLHLEKYTKLKVTAESLAADKKLAQELGAQAKIINRARLDRKKELTEPVAIFETQMKDLEGKIATVQNAINEQVKVFEAEKLAEITGIIAAEFEAQKEKQGLRHGAVFSSFIGEIDELTKLTAITASGALTAKTKAAIAEAVAFSVALQNKGDLRLAKLEAECYRLGLAAPLNQAHVNHILYAEDAEYQAGLEKIIAAEVQREQQAVAAHKARIEAEAKAKAEAEARAALEQERQARLAQEAKERADFEARVHAEAKKSVSVEQFNTQLLNSAELVDEPQHQLVDVNQEPAPALQPQASNGKTIVTCTFELDVPAHAPSAAIEAKFRKMLEVAGFTTLTAIHIQRAQVAA